MNSLSIISVFKHKLFDNKSLKHDKLLITSEVGGFRLECDVVHEYCYVNVIMLIIRLICLCNLCVDSIAHANSVCLRSSIKAAHMGTTIIPECAAGALSP